MTLVKRNADNLFPSIFDHFFSRDWMNWSNTNFSPSNTTLPAVNVKEDNNGFVIEVAAPGMSKKDFNISLDNNQLIISSEKTEEKETNKNNYTTKEFSYQSFQRSFQIPFDLVESNKINAKYQDGILSIRLPKKKETKSIKSRIIDIS